MTSATQAVASVIAPLELALLDDLPTIHPEHQDFHPYIAWPPDGFVAKLEQLIPLAPGRRFLDVGCGIGTKLALADAMGLEAEGIEARADYVALAHRAFPSALITHVDAREWTGYQPFDIVYAYLPLVDDDAEEALERWIARHMRSGALLWLPGHGPDFPGLKLVVSEVFR